jgi:hypothetical protein
MAGGIAADVPEPSSQQQQQQQQQLNMQAAAVPVPAAKDAEVPAPTLQQLLRVGVVKGIPFVAFGFFDNMIMVRRTSPLQHLQQAPSSTATTASPVISNLKTPV